MKKLLLSCCFVALPFSVAGSFVSINETWADGDRTNQDLANNSMAWYSSGGATSVVTNVGSMERLASAHVMAYFTDAGSPVILGVGQRIEMNFTVRFPFAHSGDTFGTGDFRAGLFNSGGVANRVTGDSHGGTNANPTATTYNPIFIPYMGYAFSGRMVPHPDPDTGLTLRKRLDGQTGGGAFIGSISAYETLGDNAASVGLSPGVVYYGTLVVDRTGLDSAELSYTLSDGASTLINVVRMDESGAYFTFDTVAFALGSSTASGFELQQVNIAVIPEPSTYALLFGAFGLAWVLIRRRRK